MNEILFLNVSDVLGKDEANDDAMGPSITQADVPRLCEEIAKLREENAQKILQEHNPMRIDNMANTRGKDGKSFLENKMEDVDARLKKIEMALVGSHQNVESMHDRLSEVRDILEKYMKCYRKPND